MRAPLFRIGLVISGLAIALNALGYHALQPHFTDAQLRIFETASRYLVWGGIWILILAGAQGVFTFPKGALTCIITGIFLFCGSLFLYLIIPISILMMLTPIGGLMMIFGFIWAAFGRSESK